MFPCPKKYIMSRSFFCLQLQEIFFYSLFIRLLLLFKNVKYITILMTFFYNQNWCYRSVFMSYNSTMNEPRVPLNNKDWNDIDIFLFSNGQHCSPPRKYHIKSDELELWETTVKYLAQTQYGSMHSNIELYTLDGKKINSPLELVDATSYVAVTPPDGFIPAGYEQYLIKASRSWEKRQEKLSNMVDTTGELKIIQEQSKSGVGELKTKEFTNIQDPKSMTEMDFDSIGTDNTIISRLRKENNRSFEEKQKGCKPFLIRKSVDSAKNKIIKKNPQHISQNSSKDDSILSKKRNISVSKNVKCSSSRRQSMATKSDKNCTKMNLVNSPKEKIQPNTTKSPEEVDPKEIIVLSKPGYNNESNSGETSNLDSGKDLLMPSDVYKNPDSEVQSIYIDADRKTKDYLNKIDELNDDLLSPQKTNKAISVQSAAEIDASFSSRPKVFNIKINIEVCNDRDSFATGRSGRLGKCKSYTALFTVDQGSQATINIDLNDENFKYENSTTRRKSIFSDKARLNDNLTDAKVIVLNCTCGLLEAQNINNKTRENYMVLVPSTFEDKNVERCNPINNQTADRDIKSRHSILNTEPSYLRTNPFSRENSQTIIKHKVSICPDSPIKISADIPSETKRNVINLISSNVLKKNDQFTQTEWCNILLEARPQVNGHPSFHIPPLGVLTQYNLL